MSVKRCVKGKARQGKHKKWSRKPIPLDELNRRYNAIMLAKIENRRASLAMLAEDTGLTKRQVIHALNVTRKSDSVKQQDKCGLCLDKLATCGPCKNCVAVCPQCQHPIMRDQSYTKVMNDGREIKVHLSCASMT
jgi:hypothetical protein